MDSISRVLPGRAKVILLAAAMIAFVSGCANAGKNMNTVSDIPQCNDEPADILIELDSEGCPSGVDVITEEIDCGFWFWSEVACVKKSSDRTIYWASPDGSEFNIFFDPFEKAPKASENGCLARKVHPNAPDEDIEYKYTIVGLNPDGTSREDCTHDPKVIVQP